MKKILIAIGATATFIGTQPAIGYAEQFFAHADIVNTKYFQEEKHFESVAPLLSNVEKAVECLALNIYHEARGEEKLSRYAVAWVTMNRVKSNRFPDTVCEVVHQGRISRWHIENTGKVVPLRNQCQFSWWCDGKSDEVHELKAFEDAREIAIDVLLDKTKADPTKGSLWYHADYVNPNWSSSYHRVARIGSHIFYREDD